MNARGLLIALLVLSTVGFVVGVSVEKSSGDSHDEPTAPATEPGETVEPGEAQSEEGAESAEQHAGEEAGEQAHSEPGSGEKDKEDGEDTTLLGVDLEATPFVALAAALSLALAVAVWLRPGWVLLLAVVAVVMVVFAVVDVREVFHQVDEDEGGLALLAGLVAALHLAAAGVALTLRSSATATPDAHGLARRALTQKRSFGA